MALLRWSGRHPVSPSSHHLVLKILALPAATIVGMQTARVLLDGSAVAVAEHSCDASHARWSAEEPLTSLSVVLVRSGLFRRRVDGVESVAEPTAGYLQRPGSIQQVAHPCGGDRSTVITPSRLMLGTLADHGLADQPLFTSPAVDMAHRVLVARARQGAERFELAERATALTGGLLLTLASDRADAARPATGTRARQLADQARQLLAEHTNLGLDDLARAAGVSAYHLSRTFRRVTGLTLSHYRIRLRLRRAMERLAAGERDLAGLAADLGFADQAHLTRALRAETGTTPGALRTLLTALPSADGRAMCWPRGR
jgi:AraC-like DNA-binding protein